MFSFFPSFSMSTRSGSATGWGPTPLCIFIVFSLPKYLLAPLNLLRLQKSD